MSRLIRSVSESVWSRVCWPTTLRRVVWATWSIALQTFSMATTDLSASTTLKQATAETSTLTSSWVLMPCDWVGIVTMHSETRWSTSMKGMISRRPSPRSPTTRPTSGVVTGRRAREGEVVSCRG